MQPPSPNPSQGEVPEKAVEQAMQRFGNERWGHGWRLRDAASEKTTRHREDFARKAVTPLLEAVLPAIRSQIDQEWEERLKVVEEQREETKKVAQEHWVEAQKAGAALSQINYWASVDYEDAGEMAKAVDKIARLSTQQQSSTSPQQEVDGRDRIERLVKGLRQAAGERHDRPENVAIAAQNVHGAADLIEAAFLTQPPADPEVREDTDWDDAEGGEAFKDIELLTAVWHDGLCWLTVKVPEGIIRLVPESTYPHPEADPGVLRCGGSGEVNVITNPASGATIDSDPCPGCPDCQSTPELLGELCELAEDDRFVKSLQAHLDGDGVEPAAGDVRELQTTLEAFFRFAVESGAITQPVSESPGKDDRLKAATKAAEAWMLDHDLSGYAFEHLAADVLSAADRAVPVVSADYAARAYIAAQDRPSESPGDSYRDALERITVEQVDITTPAKTLAGLDHLRDIARTALALTQPVPGNSGGVEEGLRKKLLDKAAIQLQIRDEAERGSTAEALADGKRVAYEEAASLLGPPCTCVQTIQGCRVHDPSAVASTQPVPGNSGGEEAGLNALGEIAARVGRIRVYLNPKVGSEKVEIEKALEDADEAAEFFDTVRAALRGSGNSGGVEEGLRAWLQSEAEQLKVTAEEGGTHPEERLRADHWRAAYTSVMSHLEGK